MLPSLFLGDPIEVAGRLAVEIAVSLGLELVGEQPEQERTAEVFGRRAAHQLAPAHAQAVQIEAAKRLDLGREVDTSMNRYRGGDLKVRRRERNRHGQAP